MKLLRQTVSVLTNKYLLSGVFFMVWMAFFDEKDIATDINKRVKYSELQKSELHLSKLIMESRLELEQLKTNTNTIEKNAREKYMMKKDNEDLFIVSASERLK